MTGSSGGWDNKRYQVSVGLKREGEFDPAGCRSWHSARALQVRKNGLLEVWLTLVHRAAGHPERGEEQAFLAVAQEAARSLLAGFADLVCSAARTPRDRQPFPHLRTHLLEILAMLAH